MHEAQAKDQGHRRKCSPKKEKKGFQKIFLGGKKVFKTFFQAISRRKVQRSPEERKGLRKFSARFLAFSIKISRFKK